MPTAPGRESSPLWVRSWIRTVGFLIGSHDQNLRDRCAAMATNEGYRDTRQTPSSESRLVAALPRREAGRTAAVGVNRFGANLTPLA